MSAKFQDFSFYGSILTENTNDGYRLPEFYSGFCCVPRCCNFYKYYENIFYQGLQKTLPQEFFHRPHIFSSIKFFDGQGTPNPFLLCKGALFLSKFLDILSMSLSCSLERTDSLRSQGGMGYFFFLCQGSLLCTSTLT